MHACDLHAHAIIIDDEGVDRATRLTTRRPSSTPHSEECWDIQVLKREGGVRRWSLGGKFCCDFDTGFIILHVAGLIV